MKNFNKDILDKVISNINKGLIDENFICVDFNGVKYKKLEIEIFDDSLFFSVYRIKDNEKQCMYQLYNSDFNFIYNEEDFFKTVFDYLYEIEEIKHNKEILSNTFKQSSKTKKNKI